VKTAILLFRRDLFKALLNGLASTTGEQHSNRLHTLATCISEKINNNKTQRWTVNVHYYPAL